MRFHGFVIAVFTALPLALIGCKGDLEIGEPSEPSSVAPEVPSHPIDLSEHPPVARNVDENEQIAETKRCGPDPELENVRLKGLKEESNKRDEEKARSIALRERDERDGEAIALLRKSTQECIEKLANQDPTCQAFVSGDASLCDPKSTPEELQSCRDMAILIEAKRTNDTGRCDKISDKDGKLLCTWVLGATVKCGGRSVETLNRVCQVLTDQSTGNCPSESGDEQRICDVTALLRAVRMPAPNACENLRSGPMKRQCLGVVGGDDGSCMLTVADPDPCRDVVIGSGISTEQGTENSTLYVRYFNQYSESAKCIFKVHQEGRPGSSIAFPETLVAPGSKPSSTERALPAGWKEGALRVSSTCEWVQPTRTKEK